LVGSDGTQHFDGFLLSAFENVKCEAEETRSGVRCVPVTSEFPKGRLEPAYERYADSTCRKMVVDTRIECTPPLFGRYRNGCDETGIVGLEKSSIYTHRRESDCEALQNTRETTRLRAVGEKIPNTRWPLLTVFEVGNQRVVERRVGVSGLSVHFDLFDRELRIPCQRLLAEDARMRCLPGEATFRKIGECPVATGGVPCGQSRESAFGLIPREGAGCDNYSCGFEVWKISKSRGEALVLSHRDCVPKERNEPGTELGALEVHVQAQSFVEIN